MSRYAIKSITLTLGSTTHEMASTPFLKPETREAVDVTALTDQIKQFIKGALKEQDEFTIQLYAKSTGNITVDDAPASLTLAVTLTDGTSSTDPSISVAYNKVIVTKVSPPSIEASSDRKAVYDVTFRPDGSTGTTQGGAV